MAERQLFIITDKAHITHVVLKWERPKPRENPSAARGSRRGGRVEPRSVSVSVRSLHPRCRQEGEGAAHPGGAAEDGQRQSGVVCGNCLKEHGLGRAEQGAHWYVRTGRGHRGARPWGGDPRRFRSWEQHTRCFCVTSVVSHKRVLLTAAAFQSNIAPFHGWESAKPGRKPSIPNGLGTQLCFLGAQCPPAWGVQVSCVLPGDGAALLPQQQCFFNNLGQE